ncbi:MAG TPA: hypothetical protein VIF15_15150 [Polyangiaceae bacterium]
MGAPGSIVARFNPTPAPVLAAALALASSLGAIGCASLSALECQGDACNDGAAVDSAADAIADAAGDATTDAGAADGIFCGQGAFCPARSQECCLPGNGPPSCTTLSGCHLGTDIFCDDPSQCPGGGTCWICVNGQGFQGTSCDFAGDIVDADGCNQSNALALCHPSTSQCEGGTTCRPFAVAGFDAGADASWFYACQP